MYFDEYPNGAWLDCEFIDRATGEVFFVEERKFEGECSEDFITKCQEIADENFSAPEFVRLVDPEEADILGYDTY